MRQEEREEGTEGKKGKNKWTKEGVKKKFYVPNQQFMNELHSGRKFNFLSFNFSLCDQTLLSEYVSQVGFEPVYLQLQSPKLLGLEIWTTIYLLLNKFSIKAKWQQIKDLSWFHFQFLNWINSHTTRINFSIGSREEFNFPHQEMLKGSWVKTSLSQVCWSNTVIPAIRGQRQEDSCECDIPLVYIVISRSACTTKWDLYSKKNPSKY